MLEDHCFTDKCRDMNALRESLCCFQKAMHRTMSVMNELRDAFEGVSLAFDSLISLRFSDEATKSMMKRFTEEMREFKDGKHFLTYNKLVHEDVVDPVKRLQASLGATEKQARVCGNALKEYNGKHTRVEAKEIQYARRHKGLEESKTYQKHVASRAAKQGAYERQKKDFENRFESLIQAASRVSSASLRRYLSLNTNYLLSIVSALERAAHSCEGSEPHLANGISSKTSNPPEVNLANAPRINQSPSRVAPSPQREFASAETAQTGAIQRNRYNDPVSLAADIRQASYERAPLGRVVSEPSICFQASPPWPAPQYGDSSPSASTYQGFHLGAAARTYGDPRGMGYMEVRARDYESIQAGNNDNSHWMNYSCDGSTSGFNSNHLVAGCNGSDSRAEGPMPFNWRGQDVYGSLQLPNKK